MIRMLTYQLALFDNHISAELSWIVKTSPNIASMSLDFQFTNLLGVKGLRSVEWCGGLIVLVIDVLDKCMSQKQCKPLLLALSKGFSDVPSFMRVVVVSRQETDIKDIFAPHPAVYLYYLGIESVTNKEDISEFL